MDDTSGAVMAAIEQKSSVEPDNRVVDGDRGKQESSAADIEHQPEKYDTSPENLEKSSYDITPNDDLSISVSGTTTTVNTHNETTPSSSSLPDDKANQANDKNDARNKSTGFAFTIDFNEGKTVDNRKFKEMAERIQHRQLHQQEQRRHRRGVSLSKLDDSRKSSTSLNNMEIGPQTVDDSNVPMSIASKPPFKQRIKLDDAKPDEKSEPKVTLRKARPSAIGSQATVNGKDSTKRHSWSPRSSLNYEKLPQMPPQSSPQQQRNDEPKLAKRIENSGGFQPKSTILQRALETNSLRPLPTKVSSNIKSAQQHCEKTATKDAVVTAPLEYVRNSDDEGSIGDASQATYTLDGDNYTEEEKERMSIDKLGRHNFDLSIESRTRHHDLNRNYGAGLKNSTLQMNNYTRDMKIDTTKSNAQRNSVERDHFGQKVASPKSAKSYLDKFKCRVKTIGDRTFKSNMKPTPTATNEKLMNLQVVRTDDSSPVDSDHGIFTSITACGVLNKQNQDNTMTTTMTTSHYSNGNRKPSLTKFQIDSSEYVQPKVDESLINSYTDYEKAKQHEYKLNIFSTVSSYTSSGASPVQTDDDNLSIECGEDKTISIKTAPTKNDWIQEWAKNARRRNNMLASSATASPKMQHYAKTGGIVSSVGGGGGGGGRIKLAHLQGKDDDRMSQSYDTYFKHTEQFGDDVIEDSSDECAAHTSRSVARSKVMSKTEFGVEKSAPTPSPPALRPPISPTKIPSPMHTQFRARSSSANRSFRNSNAVSRFCA